MVSQLEEHLGRRGLGMIAPEVGRTLLVDELRFGRKGDVEVIYTGGLGTLEDPLPRRAGAGRGGDPMSRSRPLEVAIVGMGCRFPGAPDLFAYWENVLAGRIVATEPSQETDAAASALADAGLPADLQGPRVKVVGDGDIEPLAAIELAAQALAEREADLAVVGGRSIEAAVVLKRRADAERDGDRIYGVVQEILDAGAPMIHRATSGTGMAGVIEAALKLYHRALPTTPAERPDGAPVVAVRPWIHPDPEVPRRMIACADRAGGSRRIGRRRSESRSGQPRRDAAVGDRGHPPFGRGPRRPGRSARAS